jgi:hypothetical protein
MDHGFLIAVPEFLDQFSRKQAQKPYVSVSEKERFWLVFAKTGFWYSAVKTYLPV